MFNWFRKKPEEPIVSTDAFSVSVEKSSGALPEYARDYLSGGKRPSTETYYTTYSTSDLVNSCVNYIAETGGLVKFRIGQVDKEGKIQPIKDKKVKELFDTAPNPFYTWQETTENMIQSYLLAGNAYMNIELLKKYELWNLEPHKMKVVPDSTNYLAGYLYNDKISFTPEEVLHLRRANSNNQYYGTSAVMDCLSDPLLLEAYGITDLKEFYENSSVGSGVLSSEFPLSSEQIANLKTQFIENYGRGTKRHSMLILPNKMTYSSIKLSPKDSMLLDALGIADDRILRVFRLNKIVLGGGVESFGTHPEEVLKMVFTTAIKPIVEKIASQLALFFQTLLGKTDIVVYCDYDNIPYMQSNIETKADAVIKLWTSGLASMNEGRDLLGLPEINHPNYNIRFLPSYLLGTNPTSVEDYTAGMDLSPTNQQPAEPTTVNQNGGSENTTTSTRV